MGIAINSYSDDSFPSFSPDGKYFFFSSNRAGNKDASGELTWDLYYMETKFLTIE
jgi:Tol biopolymer transport system component